MKINGRNFTIGADPEFFVKTGGNLHSAYGLIPGSKEAPHKVPKGAVQVDGMALEFNIDPASNREEFEDHMTSVMDSIMGMVPGYEIFVEPVADFGSEYIQSQPDDAKVLGCSPDFNAYTKMANPMPDGNTPFRTASGHVHIGWTDGNTDIEDESHLEACRALTKALDLYLGVPSLLWDKDDRRRSLYGAAGAFRPKPYGMEYRVLSNKWISDPVLRRLVYENTLAAIRATFEDEHVGEQILFDMTAQQVINKEGADWHRNALYALQYRGIPSPRVYREQLEKEAAKEAKARQGRAENGEKLKRKLTVPKKYKTPQYDFHEQILADIR